MNPFKVLTMAGLNGWTCLAFAIACAAWGLDRWDSRRHQREHRLLTHQLRDNHQALARLPDIAEASIRHRAWLPLAFLVAVLLVGWLTSNNRPL